MDIDSQNQRALTRAIVRWAGIIIAAVALTALSYLLAVHTVTGQTIENAALRGADQASSADAEGADEVLAQITVVSLAVATALVGLVALLRRQLVLAVAGVSVIVLGQAVTQTLKRFVLPRPKLVDVTDAYLHNSLPSGHTTIAMTVLFALMLVVPYRVRGVVMLFALPWAVGIGSYTVLAKWHRASDTLAADGIALAIGAGVSIYLARTGRVRQVQSSSANPLRVFFVAVLTLIGSAVTVLAAFLLIASWRTSIIDETTEYNFFLGSQSLALGGSIVCALVYWWSWRRVETTPRGSNTPKTYTA
ncbi:phosphatase PAP2 family protein [Rhodococcus qingshengii]|uniref:phosphatase PAP2 family protein n=1 Tax=Rhodococcus qingshengii TaxID=334542 RepID=UPI00365EA371